MKHKLLNILLIKTPVKQIILGYIVCFYNVLADTVRMHGWQFEA